MSSSVIPLSVAIIGAGIGGLTAAIELRQNGHCVTLFERSRFANEYGAAIHLAPNANGLLKRLGIDLSEDGGVSTEIISEANRKAEFTKTIPIGKSRSMWQHGWLFCNRTTLHNRLKREALREDANGPPAELRTSSEVVGVDIDGAITLKDGTRYAADVIVGADGAHSTSRSFLLANKADTPQIRSSGKNAYRFLIEKDLLKEREPDAYRLVERTGELISFYDLDRRIVVFPADHNKWLNVVCMHPEELSDGSGHGWNRQGNKNKLLEIYGGFSPRLRAILAQAPTETLNVWKLVDLDPLPSWTNGRFCVLGDAAHPMLPYNGQGGACAIEDAASLGVMLASGISVEDIPERLRLYQEARMQRAHELQDYSRSAGYDLKPDALDTIGKVMAKLSAFAYGHDENHHSQQVLREHLQRRTPHGLIWRSPIGFGPMPGPRQTYLIEQPKRSHDPYRSISVRMKTSRTLLQNMLPRRDVLGFASASTVAEVTWKYQSNHDISWLGGHEYAQFSLYIHGVHCKKPDGTMLVGDYLAVMLEDNADSIIAGRDELGFPKLFCDIETSDSGKDVTIRASWEGFEFATMCLADLKTKEPSSNCLQDQRVKQRWGAPPSAHAGLLVHRYVPAVGRRNEADADYIVCVPPAGGDDKPTVEKQLSAECASVKLSLGTWEELPTLHHIVARLRELPDFGMVEAKIVEGRGVGNQRDIYRVS